MLEDRIIDEDAPLRFSGSSLPWPAHWDETISYYDDGTFEVAGYGGTAVAGEDFELAIFTRPDPNTPGDRSIVETVIGVSAIDDDEVEGDETFWFTYRYEKPSFRRGEWQVETITGQSRTYRIVDDDADECDAIRDDIDDSRKRIERMKLELEGLNDRIEFMKEGVDNLSAAAEIQKYTYMIGGVVGAKFGAAAFVGGLIVTGAQALSDFVRDDPRGERRMERLEDDIERGTERLEKRLESVERRIEREIGEDLENVPPGQEFDLNLPKNLKKSVVSLSKKLANWGGKAFEAADVLDLAETWGELGKMQQRLRELRQERKDLLEKLRDERSDLSDLRGDLDACLAGHDDMLLL